MRRPTLLRSASAHEDLFLEVLSEQNLLIFVELIKIESDMACRTLFYQRPKNTCCSQALRSPFRSNRLLKLLFFIVLRVCYVCCACSSFKGSAIDSATFSMVNLRSVHLISLRDHYGTSVGKVRYYFLSFFF